ncbi:NUDIX domain-containing protein [Gracilibacillus salitolerans]|uniref:8-oxo-dGTP diphosphatase n=1 Tax=Gracilibacillus salitolerans TaxID=2663022 RepID=A0A5Q2TM14_9BACI|nr:(deoxy)nucleoside triphosphate pyrophosphohydrolase [Gracilibacillus salitolerans]QGH35117.1 NUDIX domain-containing protein [Gracilibacillus salitolerans]
MITVTAAIIVSNRKVLITKRSENMSIPNLWEFPGGKLKENESLEDCVVREINEELRVRIKVLRHFTTNHHRYDFGYIKLISFITKIESGFIELKEHADIKWVGVDDLSNYKFAPADIPVVRKLEEEGIWASIQD